MTTGSARLPRARHSTVCALLLSLITMSVTAAAQAAEPTPQASWIAAATLDSPEGIRRALAAAVAAGLGAVIAPAPLYPDGGPDRFMELVQAAHDHKLQVYASIDVDRVSLADEVPAARGHVVYQHPEWLMIPRRLAPELFAVSIRSPEYVGRLSRWTRANGVDGMYLSPLIDEAAAFVASLAAATVKRYPVDGVQLEAAKYPSDDFDYGQRAVEAFRQVIRPTLDVSQRARIDADEALDPFAYPNTFPDLWRRFRQSQLTRLVAQVRDAIKTALPAATIVAAVSGAAESDLDQHLQDWRTWMERRLIDAVAVRNGALTTFVSDTSTLVATADATAGDRPR